MCLYLEGFFLISIEKEFYEEKKKGQLCRLKKASLTILRFFFLDYSPLPSAFALFRSEGSQPRIE